MSKLTDNLNSDVEAGHLVSIGVHDGGVSVVSPASQEPGDNVGDLGDLHGYWWVSTVGARVERGGTGLTVRNMSRAQEIRELVQQVVSLVLTGDQRGGVTVQSQLIMISLPGTNVKTLNLQARDGKVDNALLHDVQSHLGPGWDGGAEGQRGGDGDGSAGLDLHWEGLHISSVD